MSLSSLPPAPGPTGRRLPDSVIAGLTVYHRTRFELIDSHGNSPSRQVFRPRRAVREGNSTRRRMLAYDNAHSGSMRSINSALSGGESYPVLVGALSIGVGVVSGGAGIVFGLITTGVEVGRQSQPVLARLGDEVWQAEILCRDGNSAVHIEYFVLWDPYRRSANVPSDFVVHESRRAVELQA